MRIILLASVLLNLGLALAHFRSHPDDGARPSTTRIPTTPAAAELEPAASEKVAAEPPPEISVNWLAKRLAEAGYSKRVEASLLAALQEDRTHQESSRRRRTRWNPQPDTGKQVNLSETFRQTEAVYVRLGIMRDGRPLTEKYPYLNLEEAVAIRLLELDYEAIREQGFIDLGGGRRLLSNETRAWIEANFRADIRAHLDESKAARYLSESSPAGRMVKDFAEKVQMSASELAEMIAATAELKSVSVGQADSDETRGQLADRMLKRYRTTLGDERFLQVAQEFNPIVSSIDPILADAQYDPAFRSELFLAYHQRIVSLRAQPREKRAELAAKVLDDLSNLKIADPVLAQKLRASPLWTALETYKKK